MSRTRNSRTVTVGMVLGALFVFAPLSRADDAAQSKEVTSKFAVTGMT